MPIIKCDNCNHSMIPRKDFYECPICHSKKENVSFVNQEVKKNHKSDLEDYINKGIDNKTLLSVLIKNVKRFKNNSPILNIIYRNKFLFIHYNLPPHNGQVSGS